jgi:hypothetical protein
MKKRARMGYKKGGDFVNVGGSGVSRKAERKASK